MPIGAPGVDSDAVVTSKIGNQTLLDLANQLYGKDPAFWGRYFKEPHNTNSQLYHASLESPVLRPRNIRVLPIAQQTSNVNGSENLGRQDAHRNVDALVEAFTIAHLAAQGKEFFMFLDVEPGVYLAQNYYIGWSQEIVQYSQTVSKNAFQVTPCLYSNRMSSAWQIVTAAAENGGVCAALWVAGWYAHGGCIPLGNWDAKMAIPGGLKLPCPVMIWQYSNDCHGSMGFDCNQVNPAIDLKQDLLNKLIMP